MNSKRLKSYNRIVVAIVIANVILFEYLYSILIMYYLYYKIEKIFFYFKFIFIS